MSAKAKEIYRTTITLYDNGEAHFDSKERDICYHIGILASIINNLAHQIQQERVADQGSRIMQVNSIDEAALASMKMRDAG